MYRALFAALGAAGVLTILPGIASAQFSSSNSRSVRSATRNYLYNRPTVSPYVNLASRTSSAFPNYHTLVRPLLDQQEINMQRQRQASQMQQQLNGLQQQYRQIQSQTSGMMLTGQVGWSARGYPRHGIYLNFYPGFQRIPRRR